MARGREERRALWENSRSARALKHEGFEGFVILAAAVRTMFAQPDGRSSASSLHSSAEGARAAFDLRAFANDNPLCSVRKIGRKGGVAGRE